MHELGKNMICWASRGGAATGMDVGDIREMWGYKGQRKGRGGDLCSTFQVGVQCVAERGWAGAGRVRGVGRGHGVDLRTYATRS